MMRALPDRSPAIVAHPQSELLVGVADLDLDLPRVGVPQTFRQRFRSNLVDIVRSPEPGRRRTSGGSFLQRSCSNSDPAGTTDRSEFSLPSALLIFDAQARIARAGRKRAVRKT